MTGNEEDVPDSLLTTSNLLYQSLKEDQRFIDKGITEVDTSVLANALHKVLRQAFDGAEWPAVHITKSVIAACYVDFADALLDAMQKYNSPDVLSGLEVLSGAVDDGPLINFFRAIEAVDEEEEGVEDDEEVVDDAEDREKRAAQEVLDMQAAAKDATGSDINVNSFEELVLDPSVVQAANDAWRYFISTAESREAAGEAIYAALFEGAPSLQSLFTTPRAVQAMRFMNGLASFVVALNDPPKLKILVETLGFGHLHLDVTVPRVIIFRDAILDLLKMELAEKFNGAARDGWKKLLNYVGGAIIFVKAHYADRIRCLLKSWKAANHGDSSDAIAVEGDSSLQDMIAKKEETVQKKKTGFFSKIRNKDANVTQEAGADVHAKGQETAGNVQVGSQNIPKTYPDMFLFNAAVMGFGTSAWMNEVLACFDNIVTNVSNSARLQDECDILALRIARSAKGTVNLGEYKSCMLASLRSLLPKDWDTNHEVAWTWLWDNVERLLKRIEGNPPIWEKALGKILGSFDEETKYEIRKDIYARFFNLAPAGQDYFKQSNTYLHIIADKILAMSLEIYQNPVKMVDDISALGLRHVGYAIPTEMFGPFVTACVEVLMTRTTDETTVESFRYALGLISKILVRTITEGSTIVMKAVNSNSQKLLKKAIQCAPRGERAAWCLLVQVGTQSISPLAWSIESGNCEASIAMIRDLLTFRADRDRYYYGVDALFDRHPDLIKMLVDAAPDLIPKLLDGLIWRSRLTDGGWRRVNYYVKHLMVDAEGHFSPVLEWITSTKDPKLICHPVIVLMADILWKRIAYSSFLWGKSWLFLSLLVFIASQSVLEHVNSDKEKGDLQRIFTFAFRCFIYLLSMTQLLYTHVREFWSSYRNKETFKFLCIRLPNYLKQWEDAASFSLTISLIIMLSLEPIIWCAQHNGGKMFYEYCPERSNLKMTYTTFSMLAMLFYYSLLLDLTVVNTRISAFFLVCARMLPELCLFLLSSGATILTFSCAISVVKQDMSEFAGIHHGAYSLLRIILRIFSSDRYKRMEDEPVVLAIVFFFSICAVFFLLNVLIAQLSCAYSAVYQDMVGYARLERGTIIVEIMPFISHKKWQAFVASLAFHRKIEFNAGDVGIAGGLPSREPANSNPTTIDMIRRFGGSTSVEVQWPEDDQAGNDENDRFDHIEKLIQKTLQRVTKTGTSRGRSGDAGGSSQNTGSRLETNSSDSDDLGE